jgi:hypothetical protein
MGIEVVLGVLSAVVLAVTVWMAMVGLLGMSGEVRFVRCTACRHLVVTARSAPVASCGYCRHPRLLHPTHWLDRHHQAAA